MAIGSVVASFVGVQLLGVIPSEVLLPALALVLLLSSKKLWLHLRT